MDVQRKVERQAQQSSAQTALEEEMAHRLREMQLDIGRKASVDQLRQVKDVVGKAHNAFVERHDLAQASLEQRMAEHLQEMRLDVQRKVDLGQLREVAAAAERSAVQRCIQFLRDPVLGQKDVASQSRGLGQ